MTNSQGHEAWGVGGVRLVAQVHLAIGLRQPVRPVLSLNASHAVLKCSLASLRLLALPNGGPGICTWTCQSQMPGVRSLAKASPTIKDLTELSQRGLLQPRLISSLR